MNIKHSQSRTSSTDFCDKKNGFSSIIISLCREPKIFSESPYQALFKLLTYDGRLAIEYGSEALNDTECEIFKFLDTIPELRLMCEVDDAIDNPNKFLVFYNSIGRLHIRPMNESLPNYANYCEQVKIKEIGYLLMPQVTLDCVKKNAESPLTQELYLRFKIDYLLGKQEFYDQLQEAIDLVNDAVRHIENVYIYIDDEIFSVVADRQINLIETSQTQGIFNNLRKRPIKKWSPAQRLCLADLWFLFVSGRAIKFEEFNGKLMTACRLSARLHKFLEDYTKNGAKVEYKIDSTAESQLFELAKVIGEVSQKIVAQKWLRSRMVNGLNFVKTEKITITPKSFETDKIIPESIASLYEYWVGKIFNSTLGFDKLFTELTDAAIYTSLVK